MNEEKEIKMSDNFKSWGIEPPIKYITQLTYDYWTINLTKKPNILFRLFLRLLGVKVKILKGDE